MNTDKAFIQFAGLTAGRASSFFDFYAHDFELQTATAGSDLQSTNLLAYSTKLGTSGFSATLSLEDPLYRRNTIYSQEFASPAQGLSAVAPLRVLVTTSPLGIPTFQTVDVSQRSRMPDFVGVLRYDAAWGSAQLSAAVKELNTGNFIAGSTVAGALTPGFALPAVGSTARPSSEYGWAVQGGVKVNLPFIAPGDTLYLQGAYGEGAATYTGITSYNGTYASSGTVINGAAFNPYQSDAASTQSPVRSSSPRASASSARLLHYWSPEWRSAVFASYSENEYARGARQANALAYSGAGTAVQSNFTGIVGTRSFALAPTLRDQYQVITGASLILVAPSRISISASKASTPRSACSRAGSSTRAGTLRSPRPRSTLAPPSGRSPPTTPTRSACACSATSNAKLLDKYNVIKDNRRRPK